MELAALERRLLKKMPALLYARGMATVLKLRIAWAEVSFIRGRNAWGKISAFLFALLLVLAEVGWGQDRPWPWVFEGPNFEITLSASDDFSPSIASNGDIYFVVWYRNTPSGHDIYGARVSRYGQVVDREGIAICTAADDQMFPAVASDGKDFLVVWQDRRDGKRWDIYGVRVSAENGQVDKPDGVPLIVGKQSNDQISPALSFDGENYMVACHGKRGPKAYNVYFTMVSRDGSVLEEKAIPVNPSTKSQASAAVAFDGENYLIVWQDKRGGKYWDVYGARVSRSGRVLDEAGIEISSSSGGVGLDHWRPVLSWNGGSYLVLWTVSPEENKWSLFGRRVGPGGEILDLADVSIQEDGSNKASPAIGWDGFEHLVIWEEEPEEDSAITGLNVFLDYRLRVGRPERISRGVTGKEPTLPSVPIAGEDLLVIWEAIGTDGYWHIYGQRLKRTGASDGFPTFPPEG